ncbi:MAG: MerR family transcriptional regulator [Bacteroidales bacterium]|nr:MerR family transcriptional regulator [Bacteroidales bacterium]
MGSYSIKQLELVSGIKAHTIRMWEKRFGLFLPNRTNTNIRRYNDLDVQLILNITLLNRNGYKISKIARRSSKEISELILQLSSQTESSERNNIEPLILSMFSFDQPGFKNYLDKHIDERGLEKTFEEIAIPLLYRIGILWQTGTINSAHEHFVTSIIKNTIIAHTELLKEPKSKAPLFLYFLPESEFHEIGLLFYAYAGKKLGFRTLYLGQSTPTDSVIQAAKKIKPKVVFTSVSSNLSNINLEDFFKDLQKDTPNCLLFVTGYIANQNKNSIPKEVNIISNFEIFCNIIKTLKLK